jgi:hypothetical protein
MQSAGAGKIHRSAAFRMTIRGRYGNCRYIVRGCVTVSSTMRTTIDIDDALMRKAMRLSGLTAKKAVVEAALRLLIQTYSQAGIRQTK